MTTDDQQAMWDALIALGFDHDGDPTPAPLLAGMGETGFREMFLGQVREARKDHDDAVDEVCMDPSAHKSIPGKGAKAYADLIRGGVNRQIRDFHTEQTPPGPTESLAHVGLDDTDRRGSSDE